MRKYQFGFLLFALLLINVIVGCGRVGAPMPSQSQQNTTGTQLPLLISPTESVSALTPTVGTATHTAVSPTQPSNTTTSSPTVHLSTTPIPSYTPTGTLEPVLPGYLAFDYFGIHPPGIAIIRTDGSGFRYVASDFPNLTYGDYNFPAWSSDGHWIAFQLGPGMGGGDDPEIYITHVDGREWRRVTYDSYWQNNITWSPDGREIAFVNVIETESGFNGQLYILDLDSGASRRIAETLQSIAYPVWSPDGKQITFAGFPQGEVGYLCVISTDGNNLRQFNDVQVGGSRISWSPDGHQIAYRSAEGCGDICILNLSNGTRRCMTNTEGGERDPTWSPDGRHIAFLGTSESYLCLDQARGEPVVLGWQVYVMNVDGSGVTQLTNTSDTYRHLVWSPVPALHIGEKYIITELGDNLNLRGGPSLSGAVLLQLHEGDTITVLEGPIDIDDYYWWKLRTADGPEGWAVEVAGWYQPTE